MHVRSTEKVTDYFYVIFFTKVWEWVWLWKRNNRSITYWSWSGWVDLYANHPQFLSLL